MTTPDPDPTPGPDEEDDALCAEYALGLLSPEERRAVEARLASDPAFRARAILWTEDVSSLAAALPPRKPPPAVESALRARLFPQENQGLLRRLGIIPAIVGALVAGLLVLWANQAGVLLPDPAVPFVWQARIMGDDTDLVVEAVISPDSGVLNLTRVSGAALPGQVLQLWLLPPDAAPDAAPVSLGLLPETLAADLAFPAALADHLTGAHLALSDEPPGGAPAAAPTGPLRASGPLLPAP
jgi:anti-sigma-K factor RskA